MSDKDFERKENLEKFLRERNIEMVDLKFTDLVGSWQHFTIPSD